MAYRFPSMRFRAQTTDLEGDTAQCHSERPTSLASFPQTEAGVPKAALAQQCFFFKLGSKPGLRHVHALAGAAHRAPAQGASKG